MRGWNFPVLPTWSVQQEKGRVQTLEVLYVKFGPVVYRRCRAILADEQEALDCLQDVFLILMQKLQAFRGDSEIMTWIYRISTNRSLNRLRDAKTKVRVLGQRAKTSASTGDLSAEIERRDQLRTLLAELDADDVQLLVHYYYDEMTQPEIARVLGVSERTVRSRLRKIEARAQEQLVGFRRIEKLRGP